MVQTKMLNPISEVLYTPEATANLLAVRRLINKGAIPDWTNEDTCHIEEETEAIKSEDQNIKENPTDINEWHRRCGHVNEIKVKKAIKDQIEQLQKVIQQKMDPCHS